MVQTFAIEIRLAKFLNKLVLDQIDEVRRFAGIYAAQRQVERLPALARSALVLCDSDAGFDHGVEHQVAALDGAVGMVKRIEIAGPLDDAGEHGGLSQITELADIFAKVGLCGFAESIHGEASALPKVDLVGIVLEDSASW